MNRFTGNPPAGVKCRLQADSEVWSRRRIAVRLTEALSALREGPVGAGVVLRSVTVHDEVLKRTSEKGNPLEAIDLH